jgi:hypothetical protein
VRDNDFIRSCIERGKDDPFIVTTDRVVDADVLRVLLDRIPEEKRRMEGLETVIFAPPLEKSEQPIGGTRTETTQREKTKNFLDRLVMSLVGGAFLVGPVWLMVLHNTHYTALITTSVLVFVCGVVTAWRLDDPIAVLSTTAAYAAVLVVFVGSNTAPSS